ncbi:MAG: protein-L-isoaspartate O-methyltransferase [Ornithinimicrobium sp.]|uniref:protein-L-isoaspartate O-methyltransferase family protein n=1 Tax=Ornithinimicrobium sp. TaxID=1977084 RepID=UPI0026DF2B86|nr:protein-L-isoaspartate O-methyltransferase [Ornithinimicrobium sp.]MDO5740788.1 protein-L-isoaspartate O-methyltransferase [Ornithinimicrobium sp.]
MDGRERVTAAFEALPRRDFLPAHQVGRADVDAPLSIGYRATNSQPSTVAAMLTLLDPQPGETVLDVGAGSGWTTALLGHLVGPAGQVVGVDVVPQLVQRARSVLSRSGMIWAQVEVAPHGVLGWPAGAPYRRVLVSAMATELPLTLVDQLADEGRMVIPVAGRMLVVERHADEVTTRAAPGYYRFVPLLVDD